MILQKFQAEDAGNQPWVSFVCKIIVLLPNFSASENDEVYSISLRVSQVSLQVFLL